MQKSSFIDTQRLARDFKIGDTVLFPIYTRGNRYEPSLGKVTAVLDKIGFVDVETPFGNMRFSPEHLVKSTSEDASYLEDTSYSTWERERAKKLADRYIQARLYPAALAVLSAARDGNNEIDSYQKISFSNPTFGDHEIKEAVELVFDESYPIRSKEAIYWKAKGRRYMPSKAEIECGEFSCPNCKCNLEQTHYKKLTKLYVCRECLFTIRPKDMLEPGQEIEPLDQPEKSPVDFFSPNDPMLRALYGNK